jgi:hypothetical protein
MIKGIYRNVNRRLIDPSSNSQKNISEIFKETNEIYENLTKKLPLQEHFNHLDNPIQEKNII